VTILDLALMYPHSLHKRLSSTGVVILNTSNGIKNTETTTTTTTTIIMMMMMIIIIIIHGFTALSGPWPPQNAEICFIIVQMQIFQAFLMLYKGTLNKPKELAVIHSVYSPYLKNSLLL
jgi:hypothetical protein